jgi:hypothetical protein
MLVIPRSYKRTARQCFDERASLVYYGIIFPLPLTLAPRRRSLMLCLFMAQFFKLSHESDNLSRAHIDRAHAIAVPFFAIEVTAPASLFPSHVVLHLFTCPAFLSVLQSEAFDLAVHFIRS